MSTKIHREEWTTTTWRNYPLKQNPLYDDEEEVKRAEKKLKSLPGLVQPTEIIKLKELLKEVAEGKRFLLQGGDCAERFLDCNGPTIQKKLQIMLQMSLILSWGGKLPTVRIGRLAGQYGKPRSSPWETLPDGRKVMSFKGDNINCFSEENRKHDPQRLVDGYFHAAATLNFVRSLLSGGFADLRNSENWKLEYVNSKEAREQYQGVINKIMGALEFMDTCGVPNSDEIRSVDFFTSHEGLVLLYESALTKKFRGDFYNLSAHFIWIGDRTRQLDHAHVEYFRGIANPMGIKVGPSSDPAEIVQVVKLLNPENEVGKIVLITRMGADRVKELLPKVVKAIQEAELNVIWQCDPMHGNTFKTGGGIKTRNFDVLMKELTTTFDVHQKLGSRLGGVHVEMTGEDVTECTGGPQDLDAEDLHINYTSYCDPRLNYAQSIVMAFKLAEKMATMMPTCQKPKIDPFKVMSTSPRN